MKIKKLEWKDIVYEATGDIETYALIWTPSGFCHVIIFESEGGFALHYESRDPSERISSEDSLKAAKLKAEELHRKNVIDTFFDNEPKEYFLFEAGSNDLYCISAEKVYFYDTSLEVWAPSSTYAPGFLRQDSSFVLVRDYVIREAGIVLFGEEDEI